MTTQSRRVAGKRDWLKLGGHRGRAIVATFAGEEVVHAEPFDAVPLDLARWWPEEADEVTEG